MYMSSYTKDIQTSGTHGTVPTELFAVKVVTTAPALAFASAEDLLLPIGDHKV